MMRGDFASRSLCRSLILFFTFLVPGTILFASEPTPNYENQLSASERDSIDEFTLRLGKFFKHQEKRDQLATSKNGNEALQDPGDLPDSGSGDDLNDVYQEDPINSPISYDDSSYFPFPGSYGRDGAAYIIGMEVLYQTFKYFGVEIAIQRTNSQVDFHIIKSKSGYFKNITKLDVVYALQEFARYLKAHLCDDMSMDNVGKMFAQVPEEEIGFRFKYDMAWALLGNPLPRTPNAAFALGRKWSALGQLLNHSRLIQSQGNNQAQEMNKWISVINDVVGIAVQLNKLMCFVDVTPKPEEEIRKRIVVKKLLNMQKKINERYNTYKDMVDKAKQAGMEQQIQSLREQN